VSNVNDVFGAAHRARQKKKKKQSQKLTAFALVRRVYERYAREKLQYRPHP
jgi:hypothetical protein